MKKKILTTLSVVLILGLAALGILAYLQDEDSDVNVMTLGNVQIDQIEKQRIEQSDSNTEEDNLANFKDNKALYPAVYEGEYAQFASVWQEWPTGGSSSMWVDTTKNVVDKFVFVENTGESPAYVRTWFAFEQGSMTEDEFEDAVGQNINDSHWDWEPVAYGVEIDGNKYAIKVATYKGNAGTEKNIHPNGKLPSGETTRPSLLQVMLYNSVTNEDVEAIDGNKDGKYNILAFSQAIQTEGFSDAEKALIAGFGEANVDNHPFDAEHPDPWDGTATTAWYDPDEEEYFIDSSEDLAGLAKLVNDGTDNFEGKTVFLDRHVDLSGFNFKPIGGRDKGTAFQGTFDGQDHTITGLSQNGWDLKYAYGQTAGMGLFGWIDDVTIKDVNIDSAEISMEAVVMGVVAGYAAGDCTFEDITVSNTQIANYNWDTGGIVGQVYGSGNTFKFKDINIEESTTISGHWGTWDVSAGGVIGRTADGVNVVMEDITVAAKLDVYNDVCAAYQWYAYRYSGMLVGYTKTTEKVGDRTVATAPHVTCKNVTVIYDDWANYTYCQASNVKPQFVRVQGGYSTDPYYSGRHWTAGVDANGNKMVDDNHVHAAGEAHNELIVFDQLFGGGQGVYGTATHPGVTVVYNNK